MDAIYGIHAVTEALRSRGRALQYVAVARDRHDARVQKLIDHCRDNGIALRFVTRDEITRIAGASAHQGVAAVAAHKEYSTLDDLLQAKRGRHRLLVLLDGVEDPHNLGAIIRTADAAGVDGLVIPDRRAVGVTATVAKAAAGAAEYLPIAKVTNLGRAIEELKRQNIWIIGLDERGQRSHDQLDFNMDCAVVLGAEGTGLHEQIRKKCDFLASIPMLGRVPSLNVSVAAAIVLYEAVRQRQAASGGKGE